MSSFIAGLLSDAVYGNDSEWIYIHVADQHPDTLRFVSDVSKFIGREVTILQSKKYACVADVVRAKKFMNSPHGAPCTCALKKDVRKEWEKPFLAEGYRLHYVWGMDGKETERANRMIEGDKGLYVHEFPLIDRGLSKADCHYLCRELGVKRQIMYDLGFPNGNCICCVKSGKHSLCLAKKLFPEQFAERAALEREIGHSCLKDVFLDELPDDCGRKTYNLDDIPVTLAAIDAAMALGVWKEAK